MMFSRKYRTKGDTIQCIFQNNSMSFTIGQDSIVSFEVKDNTVMVYYCNKKGIQKKTLIVSNYCITQEFEGFDFIDGNHIISSKCITDFEIEKVLGKEHCYDQLSIDDTIYFCNKKSEMEGLIPCFSVDKSGRLKMDLSNDGYRLPYQCDIDKGCMWIWDEKTNKIVSSEPTKNTTLSFKIVREI